MDISILFASFFVFSIFALICAFIIQGKPKCTDCDCHLKPKRAPEILDGKVSGITPSFDKEAKYKG